MVVFHPIVKARGSALRGCFDSLFKWFQQLYTTGMENAEKQQGYRMPPLTDEFLYQIIFCMEDQSNEYCVDLKEGVICELAFVEHRRKENPQRFLDIPEWYPSDGFRTMEKFVSSLRNPLYRERLRLVLQSGRGVFRQFKDVLHEQPSLERLWYYYKDREIRRRIFYWYERHDEAFRLTRLGEDTPDDGADELVREDFTVTSDVSQWKDAIDRAGERVAARLRRTGRTVDSHVARQIEEAWKLQAQDRHLAAVSLAGQFAGFLRFRVFADEGFALVRCYAIEEEFQGLGVFRYLFDTLCSLLAAEGIGEVVVRLAGDSLRIEPMFEPSGPTYLTRTFSVSVPRWCDEAASVEQSAFA